MRKNPEAPKKNNCPVCGKGIQYRHSADASAYPFCSERCRWADLYGWLEGEYVISTPLFEDKEAQGDAKKSSRKKKS
jgi:endogenous inhibitor of DNA gyrase (YacG/DUF329 family)